MPGGDGTGPQGQGPMTGRAAGYCAGYGMPGYVTPGFGRGLGGWGRGRGGGRGRRFAGLGQTVVPPWRTVPFPQAPLAATTRQHEINALRAQAEYLEGMLESLRRRLEELEPKAGKV